MRQYVAALPWYIPGLVCSLVLAFAVRRVIGRWLFTSNAVAFLLVASAGSVLAATLTPVGTGASEDVAGNCDLSRLGIAPLSAYLRVGDLGLNVILFVPLGIAISLLAASRRAIGVALLAIASPFVIEIAQLLTPVLDRSCQSGDIVDNLLGLLIGAVTGTAIRVGLTILQSRRHHCDRLQ